MSAVRRCKERDNFGRMQIFSEIFLVAAIDGCDNDTKRGDFGCDKDEDMATRMGNMATRTGDMATKTGYKKNEPDSAGS